MKDIPAEARQAVQSARHAFSKGDIRTTRRLAQQAAHLAPDWEEPWLWLAASANPQASLGYLRKALEINPASQRARQGIHWAVERQRKQPLPPDALASIKATQPNPVLAATQPNPVLAATQPNPALAATQPVYSQPILISQAETQPIRILSRLGTLKHRIVQPSVLAVLLVCLVILVWSIYPQLSHTNPLGFLSGQSDNEVALALPPWLAPTIVPSATPTSTPTATPTYTPTPTPTETPTPTPTETLVPTETPLPPTPEPPADRDIDELPEGVEAGDHWVDVDLSEQMVYAYEGYYQVNEFLVSTGTYLHPTVTGTYSIYVMYRYADMAGPGYYLPDVPYVMYFYQGYGLHGTYWHNNFGTPMSHGCVNLRIEDAGWIFDWASIGMVVHVHE